MDTPVFILVEDNKSILFSKFILVAYLKPRAQ